MVYRINTHTCWGKKRSLPPPQPDERLAWGATRNAIIVRDQILLSRIWKLFRNMHMRSSVGRGVRSTPRHMVMPGSSLLLWGGSWWQFCASAFSSDLNHPQGLVASETNRLILVGCTQLFDDRIRLFRVVLPEAVRTQTVTKERVRMDRQVAFEPRPHSCVVPDFPAMRAHSTLSPAVD